MTGLNLDWSDLGGQGRGQKERGGENGGVEGGGAGGGGNSKTEEIFSIYCSAPVSAGSPQL